MATLQDSLVSSSSRRLQLRKRPDLTVRRHRYHGRVYWVVKEPVGLNYFRFHEEEYAILNMLDGNTSLEEIKERFERDFTPQKITFQDLQHFIGSLHRSGLVIAEASGQGRQLRRRRDEKKWKEFLGRLSNIFAIRWRGIDPERLLSWMYPWCKWIYSPITVAFCVMLMISAALLVIVQFDVFSSRLPEFHQFFGPSNWIYLAVTMGVVKVIHEFGHGLTCKHFGGECHEMGAMLLVFTPALYCNVSDSWMLPNKWHRVAIGIGGMYIEGVMASIATFIWWFSAPGLLNHLCLSVMFICSVSTLLFNGNPLLRFDGYYILMDIIEIPNLRQKSTEVLKRFLTELCLGIEQPENPFLPQENQFWFGMYTVAATIYRWVVVFSILLFLNAVLEPYGLKVIGRIIGAMGFFGLVVQPLIQLGKFFYTPGRMHKVKSHRVFATVGVIAAVILFIAFVPMPFHIDATFEIEPANVKRIYAQEAGMLKKVEVAPGDPVTEGVVIARMVNLDLQLDVTRFEGEVARLDTEIATLRRQALINPDVTIRIGELLERRQAFEEQLAEKNEQLKQLTILAPAAGTVYPPPRRNGEMGADGRLPQWSGTLFDGRNSKAFLTPSDLVCMVGDPNNVEASIVVDQAEIDLIDQFLAQGEKPQVDLLFDAWPGKSYTSKIEEIAQMNVQQASLAMSSQHGGTLNTKADARGVPVPMSASFQAKAPLDNDAGMFRVGLRGRAKIYTGWEPLWKRAFRFLIRTFHFDL